MFFLISTCFGEFLTQKSNNELIQKRINFFNTEVEKIKKMSNKEEQLMKINSIFNKTIKYVSDKDLYGQNDYISPFKETVQSLKGDCDDYLVAKLEAIKYIGGFETKVIYTQINNVWHVKLLVKSNGNFFVLDSANKKFRAYTKKEGTIVYDGNKFDKVAAR